MEKSGQAAMEFLSTYGWAILVVLTAIGALAYFGVLSPSNYLPQSCVLESGVGCQDFKVDENSVTLILQNGRGSAMTITDMKVEGCTGSAFGTILNGAEATFVVDGCNNTIGQKFKHDVNVTYTAESGISHLITGTIIDDIQNGTSKGQTNFVDSFTRANSSTVGNGWTEVDGGDAKAQIIDNRMFFEASDEVNMPLVRHTFTQQDNGTLTFRYTFNFERTGDENNYEVYVQLGDEALIVSPTVSDNTGVAVNLLWASPMWGMANHEGFGHVNGAAVTQLAVLSGDAGFNAGGDTNIVVTVHLDSNTYDVALSGAGVISGSGANGIAFDNNVAINTVRIYVDNLNNNNFDDTEFDDVSIISS